MRDKLPPGVIAWLQRLRRSPARPPASRSGHAARLRGLTELQVRGRNGRCFGVEEARTIYGDEWIERTTLTGREILTERGRKALLDGREPD
jgi:hypothetical protein